MNESPTKIKLNAALWISPERDDLGLWMFYSMARIKFISENPGLYEWQPGLVVSTFEEEFQGRWMLVHSFEHNLRQGKPNASPYCADLLRIHQAGFLREYVWWYLGQPSWPSHQQPANLLSFMQWAKGNLGNHVVETHGGVNMDQAKAETGESNPSQLQPVASGKTLDVQSAGGVELRSLVTAIEQAVQRRDHAEALRRFETFDAALPNLKKESDARYVCFRSQRELDYFIASQSQLRKLRVLDWCVAMGVFIKVLLLAETQRFAEALSGVEEVVSLAPLFAHPNAEKGYILYYSGECRL